MRALRIIKREIVFALSKVGLRRVTSNYMGIRITVPVLDGMLNGGYIVPAEFWMSDCLRAFIQTRKGCVLDVGSNVGIYLVKLRVYSDQVAYYGMEPNHACYFYLQELIRLNRFKNAVILPFAFSDHRGVQMIYAGGRGSKKGSAFRLGRTDAELGYSFPAYFTDGDAVVETLGLDEIAVIKLDVEEGEWQALAGLKNTIRTFRPYLYCEILDSDGQGDRADRARRICDRMLAADYVIFGVRKLDRTMVAIRDIAGGGKDYWEEYVFAPQELASAFREAIRQNRCGVTVGG